MTSNAGASTIKKQNTIGFSQSANEANNEHERMKENIMEELKRSFRPEFLNRIDDIIVFHTLEEKDLLEIVGLMLNSVSERLKEKEINITFDEEAKKYLAKEGFDPTYGARPLRRAITKTVEDKLSEEILKGNVKQGDSVVVTADGDELKFSKK